MANISPMSRDGTDSQLQSSGFPHALGREIKTCWERRLVVWKSFFKDTVSLRFLFSDWVSCIATKIRHSLGTSEILDARMMWTLHEITLFALVSMYFLWYVGFANDVVFSFVPLMNGPCKEYFGNFIYCFFSFLIRHLHLSSYSIHITSLAFSSKSKVVFVGGWYLEDRPLLWQFWSASSYVSRQFPHFGWLDPIVPV